MNAGGTAITTPTTLAGALQLRDWTLDGVGNWASNDAQSVGDSLLTANRQHTNFNEIADVSGDVPAATFDNDDNGNLFTDDIYDYQWDALNRLRSVTRISDGLIIATSTYDCQNRRMRKVVTNSGSLDGTTDYYYAGWRVCEEYTLTGSSETLKYQYVWGATYHDEIITRDDRQGGATVTQLNDGTGADRQFQHGNTLFSVFAVTDETGTVLERYQYDPYGNQTVMDASFNVLTDSAIDQEFSYTGQRLDAETSLYYYKNRFYNPDQGRFISRDLIGYEDGMNTYQYASINPTNNGDLFGKKAFKIPWKTTKCALAWDAYNEALNEAKGQCDKVDITKEKLLECMDKAFEDGKCCYSSPSFSAKVYECGEFCKGKLNAYELAKTLCNEKKLKIAYKALSVASACGLSWFI